MSYELLFQRAVQLHEAGQLNEAEQIYRRILETAPQQPEVLNLLGLVAQAKGVQDEACSLFYQAIRQAPARAPFLLQSCLFAQVGQQAGRGFGEF